jgi:hypothetical protein
LSNSVPSAGNGVLTTEVTGTATPAPAAASTGPSAATQAKTGASPDTTTPANDDANLPKRLRGKSEEERIKTFRELESELGRKNNEVGQLRYAIDQMLQMQRATSEATGKANKAQEDEPVTGERLLTDPSGTIEAVATRVAGKSTKEVQDRLDKIEFEARKESFAKKFPKFEETMANEDFIDWVKATPHRQKLAAEAAARGSFDAAEELFGLYEEVRKVHSAAVTSSSDKPAKGASATDAQLIRPGNGNTTGGAAKRTTSGANTTAKTYGRRELANLYIRDRDSYNSLNVQQLYREGRVTND